MNPDILVWATGELTVIEGLARVGVNDRVFFADGYLSDWRRHIGTCRWLIVDGHELGINAQGGHENRV